MNVGLNIWPEFEVFEDDKIKISFTLEFPDGEREEIWYRVPAEHQQGITELADPFLIGSLFFAMSKKADIHVHGFVSSTLLGNLEEYQAIWQCWKPEKYQKISISCDHEISTPATQQAGAIIPFSAGVDSCFSVYRHTHNLCGRNNKKIEAALMVHGFDIPLVETERYQAAAEKSAEILNDVGVPLIRISTNWREIQRKYKIGWDDSHATAIIASLSLFQKNFRYGLIANTYPYSFLQWGSNPLSDRLLSSENFKIIHDGADFTRIEKVGAIANWGIANQNLRVCWQGKTYDKNCGVCEKCVRTILNYRVIGKGLPACFDKDISNAQILSVPIPDAHTLEFFQSILGYALTHEQSNDSWVKSLQKRIYWYDHEPLNRRLSRFLKRTKKNAHNLFTHIQVGKTCF